MSKKYIVGKRASYVNNGRSYKPGDEIDGSFFSEKALAAALKAGHLAEPKDSPAAPSDSSSGGIKPLDEMNLAELKDYAAAKKIPITGNKAEILLIIKEAEAKTEKSGGEFDNLSDTELMSLAADNGIDPALSREEIIEALGAGN